MINVILTRIRSSHQNLRTDSVTGTMEKLPEVGEAIVLTADPLEGGDYRLVHTSDVTAIDGELYYTRNSVYRLEVINV